MSHVQVTNVTSLRENLPSARVRAFLHTKNVSREGRTLCRKVSDPYFSPFAALRLRTCATRLARSGSENQGCEGIWGIAFIAPPYLMVF